MLKGGRRGFWRPKGANIERPPFPGKAQAFPGKGGLSSPAAGRALQPYALLRQQKTNQRTKSVQPISLKYSILRSITAVSQPSFCARHSLQRHLRAPLSTRRLYIAISSISSCLAHWKQAATLILNRLCSEQVRQTLCRHT